MTMTPRRRGAYEPEETPAGISILTSMGGGMVAREVYEPLARVALDLCDHALVGTEMQVELGTAIRSDVAERFAAEAALTVRNSEWGRTDQDLAGFRGRATEAFVAVLCAAAQVTSATAWVEAQAATARTLIYRLAAVDDLPCLSSPERMDEAVTRLLRAATERPDTYLTTLKELTS